MKNTKFSLTTDIENKEVTLMCHFKLEGVLNHTTMLIFNTSAQRDVDDEITDLSIILHDKESFKSTCQVFGVAQKTVNNFINHALWFAVKNNEDIQIDCIDSMWLRHQECMPRLITQEV